MPLISPRPGSLFRRIFPTLRPPQRQVIEDYIARIRVQLVRLLDGLGIERPVADIPVSRSLHATATFIDIAVEELNPKICAAMVKFPRLRRVN